MGKGNFGVGGDDNVKPCTFLSLYVYICVHCSYTYALSSLQIPHILPFEWTPGLKCCFYIVSLGSKSLYMDASGNTIFISDGSKYGGIPGLCYVKPCLGATLNEQSHGAETCLDLIHTTCQVNGVAYRIKK